MARPWWASGLPRCCWVIWRHASGWRWGSGDRARRLFWSASCRGGIGSVCIRRCRGGARCRGGRRTRRGRGSTGSQSSARQYADSQQHCRSQPTASGSVGHCFHPIQRLHMAASHTGTSSRLTISTGSTGSRTCVGYSDGNRVSLLEPETSPPCCIHNLAAPIGWLPVQQLSCTWPFSCLRGTNEKTGGCTIITCAFRGPAAAADVGTEAHTDGPDGLPGEHHPKRGWNDEGATCPARHAPTTSRSPTSP